MLRNFLILLLLALPLNGTAVGQDVVFNMTGELAVRAPTDAIPSPDVNGYDGASFEFEAVFEQGLEISRSSLAGPFVFQAQSATLTITGAGDGNNGTFVPTAPALYRPSNGDFSRALGAGLAPVSFNETEIALRVSAGLGPIGSREIGGLVNPIFPQTSNVISTDQFGSPNPSPIIFSDFAGEFDPTMQSDYGVVNLVITVTGPPQITHGDVNTDGITNFLDISPFIMALTMGEMGEFQAQADCNDDGVVNFLDIAPFIMALINA